MNPQKDSLQVKTSFYYPLLLLPRKKRKAMEILYRFCWEADDISDGPEPLPIKKRNLNRFKLELKAALKGKSKDPLFESLQQIFMDFKLTPNPLWRTIRGVERDLKPVRFLKFSELHQYALLVAGGPGLASMEIFGFKDKAHLDYAENLGVFLQIVNMVRDYKEDMALKRQYLPQEDFQRFHINPFHIEKNASHWRPFVEFQLNRSWTFLEKARKSLTRRQRGELATAEAIAAVYVKLYQKLKSNPYQILEGRTSLSKFDKILSVVGAVSRCFLWRQIGT